MAMRAWRVWGLSAVLMSGMSVVAKPPDLPIKLDVDGKVPPPATQDNFEPEIVPARPSTTIPTTAPAKYPLPTAVAPGLQLTTVLHANFNGPIHGARLVPPRLPGGVGPGQSREPPLADDTRDTTALQLRVLWEAAQQYRAAVESGDRVKIEKCARTLDEALKQTRDTAKSVPIP
jgi:hypothetical protein